jgi:uncharacterized protein (TIGR02302 family)
MANNPSRNDSETMDRGPLNNGGRIILSRLALFWEQLWPAIWPASAVVGVFFTLAALDILPHLPGWLHFVILLALTGAFLWMGWRGLKALRIPDSRAARRRLERVNGLAHRPLETLVDTLAEAPGTATSSAYETEQRAQLWTQHQQRMARLISKLRIGWPTPGLIHRDPFAFRIILAVALLMTGVPAWPDIGARLANAANPKLGLFTPAAPIVVDAWISPPQYTGRPPLYLSGAKLDATATTDAAKTGDIKAPAGSMLFVQVSGGEGDPTLVAGTQTLALEPVSGGGHRLKFQLDHTSTIVLHMDGRNIESWNINISPDQRPKIAFADAPQASRRAAVHLTYSATDDYGLTRIDATLVRLNTNKGEIVETGESFDLKLMLPVTGKADAIVESYHDLTPHPWAGLEVNITLKATDGVGQHGVSDTMRFKLPERTFIHPVARAIVAARKNLTADPEGAKAAVFNKLDDIAWDQDQYDNDIVVFMALTTAGRRLLHSEMKTALGQVQKLLWDTALRIEDGNLSIAEAALRQAQKALMEALARNASDSELEQLMNKLQAALSEYLNAMEKRLRALAENGKLTPAEPGATSLQRQDLQKMIDQIRSLARSGAREKARQMLSKLQKTLENMRAGVKQPGGSKNQSSKMMDDMQRLTKAQGDLLNRVFNMAKKSPGPGAERMVGPTENQSGKGRAGGGKASPGSQPGTPTTPGKGQRAKSMTAGAAVQNALRRKLGDIMQRLAEMTGKVPPAFGKAEQEMRESTRAMKGNQPQRSIDAQTRAMDALQQAMQATQQQLQQQANQNPGQGQSRAPGARARNRDPFGRSMSDEAQGANTGFVAIPDKGDLQQSRAIRDELRRRAGERDRPRIERDYIDRLLQEF